MNESTRWRSDPRKRRVFFWLAIAWAALFYLRLAVQLPFYFAGDVTTLGTLKLAYFSRLFDQLGLGREGAISVCPLVHAPQDAQRDAARRRYVGPLLARVPRA